MQHEKEKMQDLIEYIIVQKSWSMKTFGKSRRTIGICEHIKKELIEIAAKPYDLFEWIDIVILALDGAWRAGYTAKEITAALREKQQINFARMWEANHDENKAIEHRK